MPLHLQQAAPFREPFGDWWLLVPALCVGLLGGGVYVGAFSLIAQAVTAVSVTRVSGKSGRLKRREGLKTSGKHMGVSENSVPLMVNDHYPY